MFIKASRVYNKPFISTYYETMPFDDPLFSVYSPIYGVLL